MIRIEATYPATDGSAPEHISIEWDGEVLPTTGDLAVLVEVLGKVPTRYQIRVDKPLVDLTRTRGGGSITAPSWPSRSPSTESETPDGR